MAKPDIDTKVKLALKFFTAFGIADDKEPLCMFKSAYLDSAVMQILKVKAFVDSGEWESKDKLQIRLITGSHCNGRIGAT